jgi:hypothetical protein
VCSSDLVKALETPPVNIPIKPFTQVTPAMPDYCKVPGNSLQSYHNYYFNEKQRMWSWKGKINGREVPIWIKEHSQKMNKIVSHEYA